MRGTQATILLSGCNFIIMSFSVVMRLDGGDDDSYYTVGGVFDLDELLFLYLRRTIVL